MDKADNTITLEAPIKRGDNEITTIIINKPNSGALRGASLQGLLEFQTDDIVKVLPRVTEPQLTNVEVARMDPSDLLQAGVQIASFLLPKRMMEAANTESLPS